MFGKPYREPWVEPKPTWIQVMKKKAHSYLKAWWPIIVILTILTAILSMAAIDILSARNAKRNRLKQEQESCAPLYFQKKVMVAHHLFQITCLDEHGEAFVKYEKTDLLMGQW